MSRHIVVVGAGIVGSALARELSIGGVRTTVVDSAPEGTFRGSTGHAPGFVGLYNDLPLLTELAITTASIYDEAPGGFRRTGGLEVAVTDDGAEVLASRAAGAADAGLAAKEVRVSDIDSIAPGLVDLEQAVAAFLFEGDCVAEARTLTSHLRREAEVRGASFRPASRVTGLRTTPSGIDVVVDDEVIAADDVVLAGGIWGPSLAGLVDIETPIFPVAHPYVYSSPAPGRADGAYVRWPERHVYARVHGDRIGIGSYEHPAVPVAQDQIVTSAELDWPDAFDPVVGAAIDLLPPDSRFVPGARLNGVFSMTPDNVPIVGPHPDIPGLWSAQAIWVTHAAGAAALLADGLLNGTPLPSELAPDRFAGVPMPELRERALRLYSDVYANDVPS